MARLTVEFPDETTKMLDKLAKDTDSSKREVLRRAIALFNYVTEQGVKAGSKKKLSITDMDDNIERDILF